MPCCASSEWIKFARELNLTVGRQLTFILMRMPLWMFGCSTFLKMNFTCWRQNSENVASFRFCLSFRRNTPEWMLIFLFVFFLFFFSFFIFPVAWKPCLSPSPKNFLRASSFDATFLKSHWVYLIKINVFFDDSVCVHYYRCRNEALLSALLFPWQNKIKPTSMEHWYDSPFSGSLFWTHEIFQKQHLQPQKIDLPFRFHKEEKTETNFIEIASNQPRRMGLLNMKASVLHYSAF